MASLVAQWARAGAIDPEAIALVNRIIDATGAVVVISSSWRHGKSHQRLEVPLKRRGFTGKVIDATPLFLKDKESNDILVASERGHEIHDWLSRHPDVTSFIVLDDNGDMDKVRHRFIQTDFDHGIQDVHVVQAIDMLNEDSKPHD